MNVMDDEGFIPPPPSTCDHCGPAVLAYFVVSVNGTDLSFCGSCSRRFYDGLMKVGYVVVDRRDEIRA